MEVTEPMDVTMQDDLIEHELPPRPRHRLFGAGANPLALTLVGVLLCACGFIGGVLVEKGQTGGESGAGPGNGIVSRLAGLRSGSGTAGGAGGSRAAAGAGGGLAALLGGAAARSGASAGGAGSPTVGQVAYVDGHTLYVTDLEGNTIKVTTSAGANVSRTIKSSVAAIHPGEMVVVTGSAGSNGAIHAQSIRASEAGAGGGFGGFGGAALFGGGGGRSQAGGGTHSESGSSGGGEGPVLFGK